jgi:hypothetical protein
MQCNKCKGKLEVVRSCRRIRLRCIECHTEYQIHEVADKLDADTEEKLARFTVLIYD